MTNSVEIVIAMCIIVGSVFLLVGSYGLLRMPDLMSRLHAPTKATTLGVGAILVGSMLHTFITQGILSVHELLIVFFLFGTAPISAHFIARAYLLIHRDKLESTLPDTCCQCGWSMYDKPAEDHVESSGGQAIPASSQLPASH
ncbi:MAG: Na+/H+ antiporter subunit G [Pirellulaceae bacterium]|nr:Na+/H+ antiporter subunit G [Pirellulaceae bacterium]